MRNRYDYQQHQHRRSFGNRLDDEQRWQGYGHRPDPDFNYDDMYGARGEDRDIRYEFEGRNRSGYRGMSRREMSDRFDGPSTPQRYSSYPQWERSELSDPESHRDEEYLRALRSGHFGGLGPKSYRRTDARIQEDINERLTEHPYIDASDIDVNVQDGEVTLS